MPRGSSKSDASSRDDAAPDSSALPENTAAGIVGGKSFELTSGFGYQDVDGLTLILSDMASVCDSAKDRKVHPGETLVQLYRLNGTVPGAFTSETDDIKYATVKSSCPSGQPLGDTQIDKAGRVSSSSIEIAALTSTFVAGSLDITFDDGSTLSGGFNLPFCSSTLDEGLLCH